MKPNANHVRLAVVLACAAPWLTGCSHEPTRPAVVAASVPAVAAKPAPETPIVPETQSPPPVPVSPETQPAPVPTKIVAPPPTLSPGVDEVVQLAMAQVGDEVLLAYIENSPAPFELKVNEILYLHDLGLSTTVIAAMVRHHQASAEEGDLAAESVSLEALEPTEPASESATLAAAAAVTEALPVTTEPVELEPAPAELAAVTEAAPVQVTNNYFYDSLAPYGTWMDVPDYGWCWRPTVAVVDTTWQPYFHGGRWIYTDCGWYWHSYYTWGWAPFHYGRWHLSPRFGWVWAPDTYWGPAWVTWRHYDGYYGWAPLPPGCHYGAGLGLTFWGDSVAVSFGFGLSSRCYAFVPARSFCSTSVWKHGVPRHRGDTLYNNSTVINNYIRGDGNNTVINVGPGTDKIAAAGRTKIHPVALRDVPARERSRVMPETLDRSGSTLAVYRPKLDAHASAPPQEILRRQEKVQRQTASVLHTDAARAAISRAEQRTSVMPATVSDPRGNGDARVLRSSGTTTLKPQESATPSRFATTPRSTAGSRTTTSRTTTTPARSVDPRLKGRALSSPPAADRESTVAPASVPHKTQSAPTPRSSAPAEKRRTSTSSSRTVSPTQTSPVPATTNPSRTRSSAVSAPSTQPPRGAYTQPGRSPAVQTPAPSSSRSGYRELRSGSAPTPSTRTVAPSLRPQSSAAPAARMTSPTLAPSSRSFSTRPAMQSPASRSFAPSRSAASIPSSRPSMSAPSPRAVSPPAASRPSATRPSFSRPAGSSATGRPIKSK